MGSAPAPGRIQTAPSPVGTEASILTEWLASTVASEVAGEAPATAPGGGRAPKSNCTGPAQMGRSYRSRVEIRIALAYRLGPCLSAERSRLSQERLAESSMAK